MSKYRFAVKNSLTGMFLALNHVVGRNQLPIKWVRNREDAEWFDWWRSAENFKYRLPLTANVENAVIVESRGDVWTYERAKLQGLLAQPWRDETIGLDHDAEGPPKIVERVKRSAENGYGADLPGDPYTAALYDGLPDDAVGKVVNGPPY